jgi:hypothetical protein
VFESDYASPCLFRILPDDVTPDDGAYSVIAGWPTADMRLLLDEFAYRHDWHKHSEAFAEGFGHGDEVYGESLTLNGEFDKRRVDAWKRMYIKKRHIDYPQGGRDNPRPALTGSRYLKRLAPQAAKLKIDRDLVAALLSSCLRRGAWALVESTDECQFKFSAGLWPEQRQKAEARTVRFGVSGGRCEPWPNRPLTSAETSVACVRSGNGGSKVTLELADGTVIGKSLAPLVARRIPDEPRIENSSVGKAPETEVITLFRSRDFHQVQVAQSCPACRLLAADIRPARAGATIVDVGVVSSTPAGRWFRCPAGYKCGVPEFSPVDQDKVSGCAGQLTCRVWRLAEDDAEARDVIQITYRVDGQTCKNCPEGMDYASAHKVWEDAKQRAEKGCETFPDPPLQLLGKPRRR